MTTAPPSARVNWDWKAVNRRLPNLDALMDEVINPRMAALSGALKSVLYPPLSGEVGVTNYAYPWGSPYRFGADPTKGEDYNTSRIQNCIDSSPFIWIDLAGQTWQVNALTAGAGFWIKDGSLDFRGLGAGTCITTVGGSIGPDLTLSANATTGDLTITLNDASSVEAGQYYMLKSDEDWDVDGTNIVSEVIHVRSVAGNVLTLYEALDYSYTTANNAAVKLLTYLEDWRWDSVTLIGDPTVVMLATALSFLKDATLEDCQAIGFRGRNFGFLTCYNVEVRNPIFEDGDPNGLGSGTGYGILWSSGCTLCRTIGGSAENVNHAVTHGGTSYINRWIKTSGMQSIGCTGAGFDAHRGADHISFSDLDVYRRSGSTTDGVISQAARTTIENVRISGPGGTRNAIAYQPLMKAAVTCKVVVAGVQADGPCGRLVWVNNQGTVPVVGVTITGNQYGETVGGSHTGTAGIELRAQGDGISAGDIRNISITGNVLNQIGDDGIHLRADTLCSITGASITGNRVLMAGATGECILVNGTDAASVTQVMVGDNSLSGGAFGVRVGNTAGSTDYITIGGNGYHNHATANFRNSGANSRVTQIQNVSADNGDAAKTLTLGVSELQQQWNTPLAADRAVTLSTTGAVTGGTFRIVRTAAATGAFNLNVGTGPLKALAVGQWCTVAYNGSAWMLTEYGTL